jgi:hypothetical protein
MAKQIGIFKIIGTIGDITFYEMDGEFYARKKSSLDGKRVKKDPRFRRTMEEAIGFGKASTATRAVYWALPAELRVHGFYGILTGRMRKLMRGGRAAKEAQLQLLQELCAEAGALAQQDAPRKKEADGFADQVLRAVLAADEETETDLLLAEIKKTDTPNAMPTKVLCTGPRGLSAFRSAKPADFGFSKIKVYTPPACT